MNAGPDQGAGKPAHEGADLVGNLLQPTGKKKKKKNPGELQEVATLVIISLKLEILEECFE